MFNRWFHVLGRDSAPRQRIQLLPAADLPALHTDCHPVFGILLDQQWCCARPYLARSHDCVDPYNTVSRRLDVSATSLLCQGKGSFRLYSYAVLVWVLHGLMTVLTLTVSRCMGVSAKSFLSQGKGSFWLYIHKLTFTT